MKNNQRHKAIKRLDERLLPFKPAEKYQAPPKGWVRAIRDALGMSGVQFAKRLSVSPQTVAALEKSEASGSIKLETLRRAAEALDCSIVYALVPNTSLEGMVNNRARTMALHDLSRVAHTMKLEAQETGNADMEARIEAYIRDSMSQRDLWNQS